MKNIHPCIWGQQKKALEVWAEYWNSTWMLKLAQSKKENEL